MRLHPRFQVCQEAEIEMRSALLAISKKHDLTNIEYLRAVNMASSDAIGSYTKYMLRVERHGNPETPADEAGDGKKTASTAEIAMRLVDAVGEALGVDTDTVSLGDKLDTATDAAHDILREEF